MPDEGAKPMTEEEIAMIRSSEWSPDEEAIVGGLLATIDQLRRERDEARGALEGLVKAAESVPVPDGRARDRMHRALKASRAALSKRGEA
jgi:hypothetical protein